MKKCISVLVLAIMICSAFAACSEKEQPQTEGGRIITVNGKIMSNKVYEYYLISEQLNNPAGTTEEKEAAAVKQTARHLFISEMCKSRGIEINDAGRTTIDNEINSLISQYGSKEELEKDIAQYGLDYDTYYALMENAYLENLLSTEIIKTFTDEQRQEFYDNYMINVQHILFTTVDENQQPFDDAVVADKKALAEEVLAKANGGADFKEMVSEYNEDPGLTDDGYMMSKYTSFVKPFLDASLELSVNEISGLVETSYGYHIIKRYEHKGNNEWYENSTNDINAALFEQQFDNWYADADIVVK